MREGSQRAGERREGWWREGRKRRSGKEECKVEGGAMWREIGEFF